MSEPPLRHLILGIVRERGRVPRVALLRAAADHFGLAPDSRKLRAQVSRELRNLMAEGALVDGGPEVWLGPNSRSE